MSSDIEYLVSLLNTSPNIAASEIEQFILDYELTPTPREKGHPRATNAVIYYTYLKWKLEKNADTPPISRRRFFREFVRFFVEGARGTERRYCVFSKYFDKSRQGIKDAKEQTRLEGLDDKKAKRQDQKRRSAKRKVLQNQTGIS